MPDAVLPIPALTAKDRRDLDFALEMGADWIALSFVQRPEDVEEARGLARGRAAILSKIEKPAAVKSFSEILAVSDGIMVARGDLGVEQVCPRLASVQRFFIGRSAPNSPLPSFRFLFVALKRSVR